MASGSAKPLKKLMRGYFGNLEAHGISHPEGGLMDYYGAKQIHDEQGAKAFARKMKKLNIPTAPEPRPYRLHSEPKPVMSKKTQSGYMIDRPDAANAVMRNKRAAAGSAIMKNKAYRDGRVY